MATALGKLLVSCHRKSAMAAAAAAPRFSSISSRPPPPPPAPPPPINPPDEENPDPATLREQWKFAIGLYSKWYSHAWGTAILAGLSFFALGWFVKGENPLLSTKREQQQQEAAKESSGSSSES